MPDPIADRLDHAFRHIYAELGSLTITHPDPDPECTHPQCNPKSDAATVKWGVHPRRHRGSADQRSGMEQRPIVGSGDDQPKPV